MFWQGGGFYKAGRIECCYDHPIFCGVGAFGLHFAYGKAETDSDRAAAWFREHKGYKVTELKAPEPAPKKKND